MADVLRADVAFLASDPICWNGVHPLTAVGLYQEISTGYSVGNLRDALRDMGWSVSGKKHDLLIRAVLGASRAMGVQIPVPAGWSDLSATNCKKRKFNTLYQRAYM